ncbi:hypothetical cytosolic protein [Syntrophus aciditrophicus SB]|uniref:Hypothetical cytosolic protein n=1 Tax=Syntrophus aciditrophicus (strain SB) TaxID=56780 RepID=Q2LTH6_SYNAS|nr:hypothetical cytosolic protein [Syntrophus aciditrophicus SB]
MREKGGKKSFTELPENAWGDFVQGLRAGDFSGETYHIVFGEDYHIGPVVKKQ